MFRKVLIVLLTLLMFMNVPVYTAHAEETEETYILKPGRVYSFQMNTDDYDYIDIICSDKVLYGYNWLNYYERLSNYKIYEERFKDETDSLLNTHVFVYNIHNKFVTMTLNDGAIIGYREYDAPFSLVMFDGTNTVFEIENIGGKTIYCRKLIYDEYDGTLRKGSTSDWFCNLLRDEVQQHEGKGLLIFQKVSIEDVTTMNGVYEVSDTIRYGFFHRAPWTLEMDLTGIIQVFWGQLSILLPVGLIVLSVPLLMYLTRYMVRLFL